MKKITLDISLIGLTYFKNAQFGIGTSAFAISN